jgi:hypothetical protein
LLRVNDRLASNLHDEARGPQHAGGQIMDGSITGFLIGLALSVTMLVAIADMEF